MKYKHKSLFLAVTFALSTVQAADDAPVIGGIFEHNSSGEVTRSVTTHDDGSVRDSNETGDIHSGVPNYSEDRGSSSSRNINHSDSKNQTTPKSNTTTDRSKDGNKQVEQAVKDFEETAAKVVTDSIKDIPKAASVSRSPASIAGKAGIGKNVIDNVRDLLEANDKVIDAITE